MVAAEPTCSYGLRALDQLKRVSGRKFNSWGESALLCSTLYLPDFPGEP